MLKQSIVGANFRAINVGCPYCSFESCTFLSGQLTPQAADKLKLGTNRNLVQLPPLVRHYLFLARCEYSQGIPPESSVDLEASLSPPAHVRGAKHKVRVNRETPTGNTDLRILTLRPEGQIRRYHRTLHYQYLLTHKYRASPHHPMKKSTANEPLLCHSWHNDPENTQLPCLYLKHLLPQIVKDIFWTCLSCLTLR